MSIAVQKIANCRLGKLDSQLDQFTFDLAVAPS